MNEYDAGASLARSPALRAFWNRIIHSGRLKAKDIRAALLRIKYPQNQVNAAL
jgi:hypothetical protein